jgi:DNA-binding response OmpR family regulator
MGAFLRKARAVSRKVEADMRHLFSDFPPASAAGQGRHRPTVLLVEDDAATRLATESWLSLKGFRVRAAASASEAAECLDEPAEAIDVAVVDIGLPDVSGVTLCEVMQEFRPFLPVLVCSGQATPADVGRVLRSGVRRYFPKPVDPEELASAIEAALP